MFLIKCKLIVITGLTVGAKMYLAGKRQGTTMLYQPDKYPLFAIGQAHFIWQPLHESDSGKSPEY